MTRPRVAGGYLPAGLPIRLHQLFHPVDEARGIGHVTQGSPGIEPFEETDLRLVDVAGPGHHSLIDQHGSGLALGMGAESSDCLVSIPVAAQYVRPQMPESLRFVGGADQFADPQSKAHRHDVGAFDHRPNLKAGTAPLLARLIQVPCPIHREMCVEGEAGVGSEQDVFSAGGNPQDRLPGKVRGCDPWHP